MANCPCSKCNSHLPLADRIVVRPLDDNYDDSCACHAEQLQQQATGSTKIGNPVFTCVDEAAKCDVRMNVQQNPDTKKQHPMYKTTASDYGRVMPTPEILPPYFYTVSQNFSQAQAAGGMWRNQGLNTAVDRSRVLRD